MELPKDYSGADGYVEGMLCPPLRDLYREVGGVNHFLGHSVHFISEY